MILVVQKKNCGAALSTGVTRLGTYLQDQYGEEEMEEESRTEEGR